MRRANGTGSVVKLSGNRRRPYVVRVSYRDKYGTLKQQSLSYHAKAAEAQAALDAYNRDAAIGAAPAPDRLAMTVGEVYEAWSGREYPRLGPASVTSHKAAWSRVGRYAEQKMRSVTLDMWQAILDEDEERGRSQSLVNNDAQLIKALCKYAMMRDIISKDYSKYLDIPAMGIKRKRGVLTEAQMEQLTTMAAQNVPWADTVLILCYTGFRITEFLELTPASYHADSGYLQGGKKTEAGRDRIIPVHSKIKPYLMAWLQRGGGTIITRDGEPMSDRWYRSMAFQPIAQALGVPEATPHWCRHTFATRLHAAGVDPITVKWLMGHSTKGDITMRYTHDSLDVLRAAIEKLD